MPVGHDKYGAFRLFDQLLECFPVFYRLQLHIQLCSEIAIKGIFENQVAVVMGFRIVMIDRDLSGGLGVSLSGQWRQQKTNKNKAQNQAEPFALLKGVTQRFHAVISLQKHVGITKGTPRSHVVIDH